MSYRGIKRVLGETSLERKCRLLFGACLLLLLAGSFYFYGRQTEELVYTQRREKGELLVPHALARMHIKANEVDPDYIRFAEKLGQMLTSQDYQVRSIHTEQNRPKPNSCPPENYRPRDDVERQLLREFERGSRNRSTNETTAADFSERIATGDKLMYEYYRPIYADQICLDCHRPRYKNDVLSAGDMMGVMVVSFADDETQDALSRNRAILVASAIMAVFFAMIALYIVVRYVIVKPLKHLRDVADEVSRGNMDLRADIHTGDEFEEVGAAFNRMLRHLITAQQELRGLNVNLDGKVDELAQANMRLHEMNRLKSDFLATMSHELRTPLNSIIGFSDVLSNIEALDDRQRRYVKNIQQSGRMLLDMINDILDLAKIESGRMELRLADFRLESVISAQCDMARPLAEKKNIDLNVELDADLPELHQDQGKVQQILNNLLSNAIKFTPEGGRIIVSANADQERMVTLVVSDTGVGIAPQDQTAIFEKFRQGTTVLGNRDAMTREYSGTGLGLSIVKEMCKLLGGEISLVSELGKGSTFRVRLPVQLAKRPALISSVADDVDELTKPRLLELQRAVEPVG